MDGYPSKNSRTSIEDQYEDLYFLPFYFEETIFPKERKDKHDEPLILEIALESFSNLNPHEIRDS